MDVESLLSVKAALVGAVLVAFLIYERVRPAVDHPLLVRFRGASVAAWRRLARNAGLFGINLLIGPLIVVPITVWAEQFTTGLRPAWLSGWTGLAVDLIILDLRMPGVDGFAVYEHLRAYPDTASIPLIIVTADDITDEERQRLNGVLIYQKQTIDSADLLNNVVSQLTW